MSCVCVLRPSVVGTGREESVIGDFYPEKFSLDMNGKRRLWQAVVLLPFIDVSGQGVD